MDSLHQGVSVTRLALQQRKRYGMASVRLVRMENLKVILTFYCEKTKFKKLSNVILTIEAINSPSRVFHFRA